MKNTFRKLLILLLCTVPAVVYPQPAPLMGWASWNQFGVNISDAIIRSQADAMAVTGLKEAGFRYVNIDDGFFNGRNSNGSLRINPTRFPNGMKAVADYIHSRGLRAGFYSEAGENTCGSVWSNDPGGKGGGLYNHDQQDIDTIFKAWGYDFIKVDYCGGLELKLDEKTRYTAIKNAIDNTGRTDINFNVCRWQFPGVWVTGMADSWRMSGDINLSPGSVPQWNKIVEIIDQNMFLAPYASRGHYNDMDMLEVGRGLSNEEDKSHFSMWCILSSPLLLGNDLRYIKQETLNILTNKEIIAINQDTTGVQAQILSNRNNTQVWAKPLNGKQSNERAVALFNRNSTPATLTVSWDQLQLAGPAAVRDVWQQTDLGEMPTGYTVQIPAHGVVMLKVTGKENLLREVFEAEYGWMHNFNLTQNSVTVAEQGRAVVDAAFSGGAKAGWLGNRADNYIEFREIVAATEGMYELKIAYISGEARSMTLSVNGKDTLLTGLNSGGWAVKKDKTLPIRLIKGINTIRMSNATGWMPDLDNISINLRSGVKTSVQHVEKTSTVFVNSENKLTIHTSCIPATKNSVEIFTQSGQLIHYARLEGEVTTIENKLNPGVYLVRIQENASKVIIL